MSRKDGARKEGVKGFAQSRQARKEEGKGFTQRRKARKEEGKGFTQRRKARKVVVKGFAQRRKARKEEGKGFTQSRQARKEEGKGFAQRRKARKEALGAGLVPALYYSTESVRTLKKSEEFTQRNIERKEFGQRFHANAERRRLENELSYH